MTFDATSLRTVFVIDPDLEAYADLYTLASDQGLRLRMHADATAAIRSGELHTVSAMLLAAELPDTTGFELLRRFRRRRPRMPICLVARVYREADERLALRNRATLYACKPLDVAQLMRFLRHVTGPAIATKEAMPYPAIASQARREPAGGGQTPAYLSGPSHDNRLPRGSDRAPP